MEEVLRQFNTSNLYFSAVLIFLIYLLWMMMKPFLGAVIFAAIITGTIYPAYKQLLNKTQLSREFAAILICFAVVIVIFFPMVYLTFALSKEAVTLYHDLTVDISNGSLRSFFLENKYIVELLKNLSSLLGTEINVDRFIDELFNQIKSFSKIFRPS